MDRRNRYALLIALVIIGIGAFFFARTFFYTGMAAISQMDASELAVLSNIEKIQPGMSRGEVEALLGEPDQDKIIRLYWFVNRNPLNDIVVDFYPRGARRVMWASVGRFFYARTL